MSLRKHWLDILALCVIFVAVLMGWQWVWGVLFLMWTIPSLYSGEVHLISAISKREAPILYWLIIATWIGLSAYLIVADFIPFIQGAVA